MFMATHVRKALRAAKGRKLSSREITEAIGENPGPLTQPSGVMMNVIRILAQLEERGEIRCEMPNAARPEIGWYIEPPKVGAHG